LDRELGLNDGLVKDYLDYPHKVKQQQLEIKGPPTRIKVLRATDKAKKKIEEI